MRYLLIPVLFLLNGSPVVAQGNKETTFLQTKSKIHLYYVQLNNADGKVYRMGGHYDVAGSGYAIISIDTVSKQPDGAYKGTNSTVVTENNKIWLVLTRNKKNRKYILDTVENVKNYYTNLNNGYYLDHFFSMCDELNKMYPLNHYSFRDGYYTWKELPNQHIEHDQFRLYTNERLKQIKDSICAIQDGYVSLTNNVLRNIKTIDYNSLKDSLAKLPASFTADSRYYSTIITEVSKQWPEYFFRLAEDFSKDQNDLFFAAVDNNKEEIQRLRAVEGHDKVKKAFFKYRRFDKTIIYRIGATYAAIAVLIVLLID